ncbi:MAG: hypothetical protein JSR17_05650 [Proteobacteria bacterium]|nr:hypothetical protein [Pseudomonadota bacterium]
MITSLKNFFIPVKPSKQVVTLFLKYTAMIMAVVFVAIFMAQANALLRNPHAVIEVGFILNAFGKTLLAFHAWMFALAFAYLLIAFFVRSSLVNIFVWLALVIVLKNGWLFLSNAIDVLDAKFTIYEINLLQDPDKLDEHFNNFNQIAPSAQPFILEAIALNPFTPKRTLDKMLKVNDSLISGKLESIYYFQPNNAEGNSVKSLITKAKSKAKAKETDHHPGS